MRKKSTDPAAPKQSSFQQAMFFLEDLARAVVEVSHVQPGQSVAGHGPNTTGKPLIRPGGRNCYPAFWIRDFAMSLGSGLITMDELKHALLLTARLQASEDWQTPTGSFVPYGSIADHITFDGKPIFFPGTYDFEAQGQPWGYYPSLDDHFYFVEMAWHLAARLGYTDILNENIQGMSLMDRLTLAFSVPPAKDNELVFCDEEKRGVSFGFTDSVVHTGCLLTCSILRCRAARQLAELYELLGNSRTANEYRSMAKTISERLPIVFAHESGLLRASTGRSAQPDVWGSAFALYAGVLGSQEAERVSHALLKAFFAGTIAWNGNIRHIPSDSDFSNLSAWEKTVSNYPKNQYQNGAYWNTLTGWVCFAIAQIDENAAHNLALDYVKELRTGDFRQGDDYGSPYECIHPDGNYRQNPVYMTSVTCPLAAFRSMGWLTNSEATKQADSGGN